MYGSFGDADACCCFKLCACVLVAHFGSVLGKLHSEVSGVFSPFQVQAFEYGWGDGVVCSAFDFLDSKSDGPDCSDERFGV